MSEFTYSDEYSIETTSLDGFTLFDLYDSTLYSATFLYLADKREESVAVDTDTKHYLTQALPDTEFSTIGTKTFSVSTVIPYGVNDVDPLDELRAAIRTRRILGYRDNRGRLNAGYISSLAIKDLPHGNSVAFKFNVVNYEGIN